MVLSTENPSLRTWWGVEEQQLQLPDDGILIGRIGNGDEDALKVLYERYAGLLYTLALRIVGDRQLAEEVLQNAFVNCWKRASQFDAERGQVRAWLFGITRNSAIDMLRSHTHQDRLRSSVTLPGPGEPGEPRRPDETEGVALRLTIQNALAELPSEQRQLIELAYFGGLTQSEIAGMSGVPLGTVKTRMRAGMQRLRQALVSGAVTVETRDDR
jgi:RNA polymerase sigma-70 factor, ECF subfamily